MCRYIHRKSGKNQRHLGGRNEETFVCFGGNYCSLHKLWCYPSKLSLKVFLREYFRMLKFVEGKTKPSLLSTWTTWHPFVCLLFYVLLEITSFRYRRHHLQRKDANFTSMLDTFGFCLGGRGGHRYHSTPELGFIVSSNWLPQVVFYREQGALGIYSNAKPTGAYTYVLINLIRGLFCREPGLVLR